MKDRLEKLIASTGLNISEFAQIIGYTQSYVSSLLIGIKKNPSKRFYLAVKNAFHVRIEWLQDGEGEMLIEDDPELTALERELVSKYQKLPESVKETVDEVVDALLIKHLQSLGHDAQKQEK